jgi:hypothetical protein
MLGTELTGNLYLVMVRKHTLAYLSLESFNKNEFEALIENAMNCKYFSSLENNKDLYHTQCYAISWLKGDYQPHMKCYLLIYSGTAAMTYTYTLMSQCIFCFWG